MGADASSDVMRQRLRWAVCGTVALGSHIGEQPFPAPGGERL
jgi:hypothetical protein